MDPLLTKDRPLASEGILTRLDKNLAPPSYISPSFPGRVQDPAFFDPSNYLGTNGRPRAVIPAKSYVLAGSPFAAGAPGYNPSVSTPPTTVTGGPFGIQMGVMPDGSVLPRRRARLAERDA